MDKADKIFKSMALYVKIKDKKLSQCSRQEVDKPKRYRNLSFLGFLTSFFEQNSHNLHFA